MSCTLDIFKPKVKYIYLYLALRAISWDSHDHFHIDPQTIFFYSRISKKN